MLQVAAQAAVITRLVHRAVDIILRVLPVVAQAVVTILQVHRAAAMPRFPHHPVAAAMPRFLHHPVAVDIILQRHPVVVGITGPPAVHRVVITIVNRFGASP
jgi:hypothetical protein